jgi:hypothetical protein
MTWAGAAGTTPFAENRPPLALAEFDVELLKNINAAQQGWCQVVLHPAEADRNDMTPDPHVHMAKQVGNR